MESGRVLLGSPSGLVVGRKASRDPGPRACVARPAGTRCPLALCCFLLHSTLGVSPVPVIVGALLSRVALGTPALRSFPMPSPEPLPGGHLHSHGALLLPTSPREMGPAVGLGCPPPERGLGGGRRPPASPTVGRSSLPAWWGLPGAFHRGSPEPPGAPALGVPPGATLGAAGCAAPAAPAHPSPHRALLPPAFNSRGSNELEQRSMLSGLLLCGFYSDMRKTLQHVELL